MSCFCFSLDTCTLIGEGKNNQKHRLKLRRLYTNNVRWRYTIMKINVTIEGGKNMNTVGVNYIHQYFDAMLMQTSFKYAALKNRNEQIYVA